MTTDTLERARSVAAGVTDPELPMLTLADLGVLRDVHEEDGTVVVTITPTYTGCPAMATMRADLQVALRRAGFEHVDVRTSLAPAWTTDWMTPDGRQALADAGIAPPATTRSASGPVDLLLGPPSRRLPCPQCGSDHTAELSRFGSTACKSLQVCRACGETFDHFKEI
ncbi:MAG: 1,2-phenylacetyl-CoA epoxidase subunit PaaD [Marmoricola sp.]